MQQKKYFFLFMGIILTDLVTKALSVHFFNAKGNPGIFLGHFADSPVLFRVISLSTLAGFLLLIYSMLILLLPKALEKLKYSLTVLIGGVSSNVIDRVHRGVTIDFIPFRFSNYQYYFNFADVCLFMGALYCIYLIFFEEESIWFSDNERKMYLVNTKEQIGLALKFVYFTFMASLILGIFSITFIKSYFSSISSMNLNFYIGFYLIILSLLIISVFLLGLIISHRTAGPLYAFEQYVENILNGEDYELLLREGDNYKHLEEVARKLRKHINK